MTRHRKTCDSRHRTIAVLTASAAALHAGLASAAIVDATVTADNHYALYATGPGGISYVGGNEIGAGGSHGGYNWSHAETWSFNTGPTFYIAAWSDNSVAQGVLAQIVVNGTSPLHSGNAAWQVYETGVDAGDGTPHPGAAWISEHVSTADAEGLWEAPFVGGANGINPWRTIAGITSEARWTWWNNPAKANPLNGGTGAGELLIFRVTVPTPGTMATAALGLAMMSRRRRI